MIFSLSSRNKKESQNRQKNREKEKKKKCDRGGRHKQRGKLSHYKTKKGGEYKILLLPVMGAKAFPCATLCAKIPGRKSQKCYSTGTSERRREENTKSVRHKSSDSQKKKKERHRDSQNERTKSSSGRRQRHTMKSAIFLKPRREQNTKPYFRLPWRHFCIPSRDASQRISTWDSGRLSFIFRGARRVLWGLPDALSNCNTGQQIRMHP